MVVKKRKEGVCKRCEKVKEITAKNLCHNCYHFTRLRENSHALEKRRKSSLISQRKISGKPLSDPVRDMNNRRIINNTENWAIQYLNNLGYEIRKSEK